MIAMIPFSIAGLILPLCIVVVKKGDIRMEVFLGAAFLLFGSICIIFATLIKMSPYAPTIDDLDKKAEELRKEYDRVWRVRQRYEKLVADEEAKKV